ncbi:MAG: hypothetical protein CMH27_04035 [Micavibrio sp.]|nr:hypothetical protein [Micavibrio sp.]
MILLQALMARGGVLAVVCAVTIQFPAIYKTMNASRQERQDKGWLFQHPQLFLSFALLGWAIIYYNGVHAVLWFIPDDWGQVGENGWLSFRSQISGVISGLCVTLTIMRIS